MKREQLKKRIERARKNFAAKALEYGFDKPRDFELKWKPRKGVFERTRCTFNPIEMHATSYTWYDLLREFNGVVVLNDYGYSNQTSKHRNNLASTLRALGIKYQELEAPRGLQDLSSALNHTLNECARTMVAEHFARKKGGAWYRRAMRDFARRLALLESLGHASTFEMGQVAMVAALQERSERLELNRKRSALKRARAKIEVIIDLEGERAGEQGMHAECGSYGPGSYQKERAIDDAITKGFTRVFFHREGIKAPSFQLIQGGVA